MTLRLGALHDALVSDLAVLKWMSGCNLALSLAVLWKVCH